jgi:hypothetical protein
MKYGDLFTLNPIETVIQLEKADKKGEAKLLVERFVITPSLGETIETVAIPQLDFLSGTEGKGIFVVGNYGTGKSHVMSFLSILAEDASYLTSLRDPSWTARLARFAGQYRVKRCELSGTMMNLYQIVAEQLQQLAKVCGFSFTFRDQREITNVKDEFERYMVEFDKVCPSKGVLLIIDELLEFLKYRNDMDLVLDLSILRALGEYCNGSRFALMAGVQELLYNNPRFNHIAADVNRVRQRFNDFVIDNRGIKQLIEQHLFQKNESQRQTIRELLLKQAKLFEVIGPEIEQFVALFPAHPRFIDEFQRVLVVERREILTVLSKEGRVFAERQIDVGRLDLITSDEYWKHIERDAGLNANGSIRKIKENVAVLKGKIQYGFPPNEDRAAAEKLVEALAVHRLTTPYITDTVGLTSENLKNNLLWYTPIPVQDATFLTNAAKRILDKTRQAANGQFLAVAETTGQYYIDPSRVVDYDQDVATAAETIAKHVVQRYLNEIITRALELKNVEPVLENRLWSYNLLWTERKVERPGWLFFGYPNQRSTAKPPRDFYLFLLPSERLMGPSGEDIPDNPDESYWFFEDFPAAKCDVPRLVSEDSPDTFLDKLRKYAAARECAKNCAAGDDRDAFDNIAKRFVEDLAPDFVDKAGDWIRVKWNGQNRTFREWVMQIDASKANALFQTRFDTVSQAMFAPHFSSKYPDYPTFTIRIQEGTRAQNALSAIEILCEVGMVTQNGQAVLIALGLYSDGTITPDQSPWLARVRDRLKTVAPGQYINASELFEQVDDKWWFKGERIEAEWLLVVLAAGIRDGDLHLYGKNNKKYDATNLREFYQDVKTHEAISRISKPSDIPLDLWRRLFKLFGLNTGLLANPATYDEAIMKFCAVVLPMISSLTTQAEEYKTLPPLITDAAAVAHEIACKSFGIAQKTLEYYLQPINTKAKMQNLRILPADLDDLEKQLAVCKALTAVRDFVREPQTLARIEAVQRLSFVLKGRNPAFESKLDEFTTALNGVYAQPETLGQERSTLTSLLSAAVASALKTYHDLHKRHRLNKDADKRKKDLVNGANLKRLNKLSRIKVRSSGKLQEIQRQIDVLVSCNGCLDDDLVTNFQSLCPRCSFNPADLQSDETALDLLTLSETTTADLLIDWERQLLSELEDPSVQASLNLLTVDARALMEKFLADNALPTEITDAFIAAINTVFSGLKRRSVKAQAFAKQIIGDGIPLKPDEMQARFEKWLKDEIGNDDKNTVRFVLEE